MSGVKVKTVNRFGVLKKKTTQAMFRNFGHAGGTIRLIASRSIRAGKKPSTPGTPPHTRKSKRLKRAIVYNANEWGVIVGPSAELTGDVGKAHEYGGRFRDERYDKRPFMVPALEKAIPQIPRQWRDSIRE